MSYVRDMVPKVAITASLGIAWTYISAQTGIITWATFVSWGAFLTLLGNADLEGGNLIKITGKLIVSLFGGVALALGLVAAMPTLTAMVGADFALPIGIGLFLAVILQFELIKPLDYVTGYVFGAATFFGSGLPLETASLLSVGGALACGALVALVHVLLLTEVTESMAASADAGGETDILTEEPITLEEKPAPRAAKPAPQPAKAAPAPSRPSPAPAASRPEPALTLVPDPVTPASVEPAASRPAPSRPAPAAPAPAAAPSPAAASKGPSILDSFGGGGATVHSIEEGKKKAA